ncbi:MAG: hypothetical protein AABX74_01590, partial [Nanoarchaeota archaeon]
MPISPQQQYADYGLIVPRHEVRFRNVSDLPGVRVEPVSGIETKVKPVVITTKESYDFEGVESGRRNGLFSNDGTPYKIDGGRIEPDLERDGLYRTAHRNSLNDRITSSPEGGYTLGAVELKVNNTLFFNELFAKWGFPAAF